MNEPAPARDVEDRRSRVRFILLKNRLREKLASGARGPVAIDPAALAKAEAAFQAAGEDYPDWVMSQIDQLRQLHARAVDTPAARRRTFAAIRQIAMELKGQGATFGYPLVTVFAGSLYDAVGPSAPVADAVVELAKSHLDAIAAVIKDRVRGDGGETGAALRASLAEAQERFRLTPSPASPAR